MNPVAVFAALAGLTIAIYAALETEVEQRSIRAGLGIIGLLIFAFVVLYI